MLTSRGTNGDATAAPVKAGSSAVAAASLGASPAVVNVPPSGGASVGSLFSAVWRRKWILFVFVLLGLGGAFLYVTNTQPKFTTGSLLCASPNGPRIISDPLNFAASGNSFLYTQVELIRSTAIVASALESAAVRECPTLRSATNPVATLKACLDVVVSTKGDLITVLVTTPHADDSALLANSLVDSFIAFQNRQQRSTAAEVLRILEQNKTKLNEEMAQTSSTMLAFMKAHGTLSFDDGKGNVVTQRLAQLSDALAASQMESLNARIALDTVNGLRAEPARLQQFIMYQRARGEQVPFVDRNSDRALELQALERRKALMKLQFGENHPQMGMLDMQINIIRGEMMKAEAESLEAYVSVLEQMTQRAQLKEDQLRKEYEAQKRLALDLSGSAAEYALLQSGLRRIERELDTIDSRIRELNVTESSGVLNISVLEPARAEAATVRPKRDQSLLIGGAIGLMLGLGLALLFDLADQRLRTVEEITRVVELPILGVVPAMASNQTVVQRGQQVHLYPRSSASEAYRAVRTALFFGSPGGFKAKTILVTSPTPRDGKSACTSNLAIVIAQAGRRVLLIDADCRKPVQHVLFGVAADTGLADVLLGKAPVEAAIQRTSTDKLDILPCGPLPNNPSELLDSPEFAELIARVSSNYDQIVIDSSPVVPVTDARILAAFCDATVLVLRAGKSTRKLATYARELLDSVGASLMGVVVNGVVVQRGRYSYGQYGYGYGYGYSPSSEGGSSRTREVKAITVRSEGRGENGSGNGAPASPPVAASAAANDTLPVEGEDVETVHSVIEDARAGSGG